MQAKRISPSNPQGMYRDDDIPQMVERRNGYGFGSPPRGLSTSWNISDRSPKPVIRRGKVHPVFIRQDAR